MLASIGANTLSLAVPISMIHVYDRIIPNAGYETLAVIGIVIAVAIVLEAVLRGARRFILERAGEQFELQSYSCALNVVINGDPAEVDRLSRGRLMAGTRSIERLRSLHTGDTALALLDLPFALLFLFAVTLISPVSGLVVGSILACTFLVLRMARRRSQRVQEEKRQVHERKASFLGEVFSGIEAIKSLRIEAAMRRRYERLIGAGAEAEAATTRISHFAQGFTATAAAFSPVLIACIGAFQVMDGQMTVGALAAVILLTGRIIQPALRVEAYLAGLSSREAERKDLEDILTTPVPEAGQVSLTTVDEVAFDQLTTPPMPGLAFRFQDVSLSLRQGDCVAITGPSHQACSSFLKLFLDECHAGGRYRINGRDVADYDPAHRYREVRYLGRDEPLLTGTLLENLTNFQVEEFQDEALRLARKLGLDKALATTKDGFNVPVGQGANAGLPASMADVATVISGLVGRPDLVLFDQVNAAFDRETDQRFLDLVAEGMEDRITLISTGRPSFRRLAKRSFDITPFLRETAVEPKALAHA